MTCLYKYYVTLMPLSPSGFNDVAATTELLDHWPRN